MCKLLHRHITHVSSNEKSITRSHNRASIFFHIEYIGNIKKNDLQSKSFFKDLRIKEQRSLSD